MRYLMLGVVLLFSTSGVTRADGGLTDAIASSFLLRTVDAGLHDIAHARATEIAAAGSLDHDGMRPGTAEVLAWNTGEAYPIASAVSAWIGSPPHNAILSNRSYGRIGCAAVIRNGVYWFACVLAATRTTGVLRHYRVRHHHGRRPARHEYARRRLGTGGGDATRCMVRWVAWRRRRSTCPMS